MNTFTPILNLHLPPHRGHRGTVGEVCTCCTVVRWWKVFHQGRPPCGDDLWRDNDDDDNNDDDDDDGDGGDDNVLMVMLITRTIEWTSHNRVVRNMRYFQNGNIVEISEIITQ